MITIWVWDYHQTGKFDKIFKEQQPRHKKIFKEKTNKSATKPENLVDQLFQEHGFRFLRQSKRPSDADYQVISIILQRSIITLAPDDLQFLAQTQKPVIIWEKTDSGTVLFRHWSLVPTLKAVFKNRIIRDRQLLNGPLFRHRYHFFITYQQWLARQVQGEEFLPQFQQIVDETRTSKIPISEQLWPLYQPVVWDLHEFCLNKRLNPFRYLDIDRPRSYDVFCAGNFRGGIEGWHRQQGRQMCQRLKQKFRIWTNETRVTPEVFATCCADSRIVIGWYGHGEWVHADGYAFCGGMVLIKPRVDFLQMPPGRGSDICQSLYQDGRTYVACQPDFSDLEEKIDYVLSHWDEFRPMLERNQYLMKKQTLAQSVEDLSLEMKLALQNAYRPKKYVSLI